MFQLPSPRMVETYRFFIDAGADAVVNHHQHCYSGYEVYNEKPIFYGLGNFGFDLEKTVSKRPWNYGYMVEIDFSQSVHSRIIPYYQYAEEPQIKLLEETAFNDEIKKINEVISSKEKLQEEVNAYYKKVASNELSLLEPYRGRLFGKLYDMGLLPQIIKGGKKYSILNHIMCESHHDKLLFAMAHSN